MTTPTIHLDRDTLLRCDDCAGALLRVLDGAIWLTEEGDPHDHCLRAGEGHRIRFSGRVVLQACGAESARLVWETPRHATGKTAGVMLTA